MRDPADAPRPTRHSHSCESCNSRLSGVFATLDPVSLAQLTRTRIAHSYDKGQVLFYEGNPCTSVFCIESGVAKVYKNGARNRMYILYLAKAGDVLGLEALLAGDFHAATAEMLEGGIVCALDRAELLHVMDDRPRMYQVISSCLAEQLRRSEEDRAELASAGVRERLALTLLTLATRYGEEVSGHVRIGVDLSRDDLADMVGTTTETAIRYLGDLRDRHILSTDGRTIFVDDLDRLARLARLESGPV